MITRRLRILAVFAVLAVVPSLAEARGYGRSGGTVNTPFGTMNTRSPEYRMAGGNPFVYQELMQQKMLMLQQQKMLKQQQQSMQKMQKQAKNRKGKDNLQPAAPVSTVTSLTPRKTKKKKTVTAVKSSASKPSTVATSSEEAKSSSKPANTKP